MSHSSLTALPRTEYTADVALGYVRDTESLRNPVERALAAEVHRLRECCDQAGTDLAHMIVNTQPVISAWRALSVDTLRGRVARLNVELGAGSVFVAALDEMAENL